jgi:hypothetical protein
MSNVEINSENCCTITKEEEEEEEAFMIGVIAYHVDEG